MAEVTAPLKHGNLRAQHLRFSPGGSPVVIIEADGAESGDDAEICLDMAEAAVLHEWLGKALNP